VPATTADHGGDDAFRNQYRCTKVHIERTVQFHVGEVDQRSRGRQGCVRDDDVSLHDPANQILDPSTLREVTGDGLGLSQSG